MKTTRLSNCFRTNISLMSAGGGFEVVLQRKYCIGWINTTYAVYVDESKYANRKMESCCSDGRYAYAYPENELDFKKVSMELLKEYAVNRNYTRRQLLKLQRA